MSDLRNGNVYIPNIHSSSDGLRVYSSLEKAENDMLGHIRLAFSKHRHMAYCGLEIDNLQVDTGLRNKIKYVVTTKLNREGTILTIEVERKSLFDKKIFKDKIAISA